MVYSHQILPSNRGDVVAMQKKYLLAYDMDVDDSDDETKVEPKPKKAKH